MTQPCMERPLRLLVDPDQYVACGVDLGRDAQRRSYWLTLFRDHFPRLMAEAVIEAQSRGQENASLHRRCQAATQDFLAYLNQIERDPEQFGRLDILSICIQRERVLRKFDFDDPYRLAKTNQNQAAMALLPQVLAELDGLPQTQQAVRLIEGIFAGNIFDLGVTATMELFASGPVDFYATRSRLKARPWLVDDLDLWLDHWSKRQPHRCAALFVDNAGVDIVLGMIPFARCLLERGTKVIMTANSTPSLNDVTHSELLALVQQVGQWDRLIGQALADERLMLIASGNGVPLIDLAACAMPLVEAVHRQDVDLVVLEGMGRALESNFDATFSCDALKIAMIKDRGVAEVYGGQVFDLVFRYEPRRGESGV